jgi:uncharacterized protein YlzI (FlbEa/FlbD family)
MNEEIKNKIIALRNEIQDGNLDPYRVSEMLVELTSLFANANEEVIDASLEYNRKLLVISEDSESVAKAKLKAETTEEWRRKRQAENLKEWCVEMIRSLKYFIKSKIEELK